MYKAAIFDLDGTILNTIDDLADAGNHMLRLLGFLPFSIEEYKQKVGDGVPKLIERLLPPQAQGKATQELALHLFSNHYKAHMQDKTAPYAGIPELLAYLKSRGVLLGVVSNKTDEYARAIVEHYFPDVFNAVAGCVPGAAPKPNPEGVNEVRTFFECAQAETLYIGDSNVDMLTAQNANLTSCGVLWGFRTQEELTAAGANYLANTPLDIAAILFAPAP